MTDGIWVLGAIGIVVLAVLVVLWLRAGRGRSGGPSVVEALAPPPFPGAEALPDESPRDEEFSDARPGPYPGSAWPGVDGSAPSDRFMVKAEMVPKRYHTPSSSGYRQAHADVWFRSPGDAEAAGFTQASPRG
ncbi:sunset domain-containing protein [Pseudonocardia asaccharolytica]|nr:hypothetical protein [Pseudonocardia asaccharolytica]